LRDVLKELKIPLKQRDCNKLIKSDLVIKTKQPIPSKEFIIQLVNESPKFKILFIALDILKYIDYTTVSVYDILLLATQIAQQTNDKRLIDNVKPEQYESLIRQLKGELFHHTIYDKIVFQSKTKTLEGIKKDAMSVLNLVIKDPYVYYEDEFKFPF
jgi:hypothetical protein